MLKPEHFMREEYLEGAASGLLRKARARDLWDGNPPVPLERIVEQLQDVRIEFSPLSDARGTHVFGKLVLPERTIYLNEADRELFEQTVGLERYTLAHEAGHFALHVDEGGYAQTALPLDLTAAVVLCRDGDRSPREYQAERFAAFLLMPEDLVRKAVAGRAISRWSEIYELRDLFGASGTAMRNRLAALGYAVPTSQFAQS